MANNDTATERNLAWERMEYVIGASGMALPDFARYIGLPRDIDFLLPIKNQICGISFSLAERICRRFPQYSPLWLATGCGSIYNTTAQFRTIPFYDCDLDDILDPDKFVPQEQLQMLFMTDCDFAIRYRYYDMGELVKAGSVLFVKEIKPETVQHDSLVLLVFGTHAVVSKIERSSGSCISLVSERDGHRQVVNIFEIRRAFQVKATLNFNR